MPRQRQRIVFCDCFDCRDRPEVSLSQGQLDAATAVARQEPPPKALLIYATGFVVAADGITNLESCTLPHCNLVVREGNLGLLAVRPARDGTELGSGPAISELAQLLGVYQECGSSRQEGDARLPSLAARFKGMQAALVSTSGPVRQLAERLGMAVVGQLSLDGSEADRGDPWVGNGAAAAVPAATPPLDTGTARAGTTTAAHAAAAGAAGAAGSSGAAADGRRVVLGLPDAGSFAAVVSAELGAAEGASGRDLLLLHLDLDDLLLGGKNQARPPPPQIQIQTPQPAEAAAGAEAVAADASAASADAVADADVRWDAGCEALEWMDSLVKGLLALPEIRERTLLMLMLSPAGQKVVVPGPAGGGVVVAGGGGGAGGALLQPGGTQLDPSAMIVTPRNLAQLGRGGGAAAAAAAASGAATGGLSVLDTPDFPLVSRPVQSFEFLGMERVETDAYAPVLVARRLPGVVRRDRAERLSYKEALTAGGVGVVLMDRLLPEVAYKIGRAPKYGA